MIKKTQKNMEQKCVSFCKAFALLRGLLMYGGVLGSGSNSSGMTRKIVNHRFVTSENDVTLQTEEHTTHLDCIRSCIFQSTCFAANISPGDTMTSHHVCELLLTDDATTATTTSLVEDVTWTTFRTF